MSNIHLAVQFFLQLAVILLFCRLVGAVAARFGQPQVVAEMIAGVLLGPSLFGLLWPEGQMRLFPWDPTQATRDTQSYLFPAAQLGLALYMFIVGLEFRVDIIHRRLKSAVAVSLAGMITPFILGGGLGWFLFPSALLCSRRCFFWAPRCASRPFRCSRGLSSLKSFLARRWARLLWVLEPLMMRPLGVYLRSSWRALIINGATRA